MSDLPTITHAAPTPPFLHLIDCPVSINSTTGEIEVGVQLHEGVRFTICPTKEQAGRLGVQLMQASIALYAATVSVPSN